MGVRGCAAGLRGVAVLQALPLGALQQKFTVPPPLLATQLGWHQRALGKSAQRLPGRTVIMHQS